MELLIEVNSDLRPGDTDRSSLDVDIDQKFFCFVVFDLNDELVLEASADIVEQSQLDFDFAAFDELSDARFAEDTETFVIRQVQFLGLLELSIRHKSLAHLRGECHAT